MNREDLRAKYLETMPDRIINGDERTYAEWIEDELLNTEPVKGNCNLDSVRDCVRVLETMHSNTQDEFHKHRVSNFDGLKVTLTGKEMNEIIRVAKIRTKREYDL